jgi:hypothetical protein
MHPSKLSTGVKGNETTRGFRLAETSRLPPLETTRFARKQETSRLPPLETTRFARKQETTRLPPLETGDENPDGVSFPVRDLNFRTPRIESTLTQNSEHSRGGRP